MDALTFLLKRPQRLIESTFSPAGKTVLVTGAGGFIGTALCTQIAQMHPSCLVMVDFYENTAYTTYLQIRDTCNVQLRILSVCDRTAMENLFATYHPQIIFHAAAHKHVPLMQLVPCEAVKNNVGGTKIVLDLAARYESEKFVLISTDKAIKPVSIMGQTKRVCELLATHKAGIESSIARFANVFGSSGSVVPIYRQQIQAGGPVTVIRGASRYFISRQEAVSFLLFCAAQSGFTRTFILDAGQAIEMEALARNLIYLSGGAATIQYIPAREGDRMQEEYPSFDNLYPTSSPYVYAYPVTAPKSGFPQKLAQLQNAAESGDDQTTAALLKEITCEY